VNSLVDQPLLGRDEIAQLIAAGVALAAQSSVQINQHLNSGSNQSSLMGSGTDFDDLRIYQSGDDLCKIDWRASARSQEQLVRTYRSEFQQPFQLIVDRNSTMRFGTKKRLKVTQAARLSLWLLGLYHQQGYALGALLLEQDIKMFDCRVGVDWLNLLSDALVSPAPPSQISPINWHTVLTQLITETTIGTKVVLISDFRSLNDAHRALLRELAERTTLSAFVISDPMERDPLALNDTDLIWRGQTFFVDGQESVHRLQQTYLNQLSEIQALMSQSGIPLFQLCSSVDQFSRSLFSSEYYE